MNVTPETIIKAMEVTHDIERDIKQEVAKMFWQHNVAAQHRPKRHRK